MAQTKIAAQLHIHNASAMSTERKKEIAEWLKMHAADLVKDGKDYDNKFKGTFFSR